MSKKTDSTSISGTKVCDIRFFFCYLKEQLTFVYALRFLSPLTAKKPVVARGSEVVFGQHDRGPGFLPSTAQNRMKTPKPLGPVMWSHIHIYKHHTESSSRDRNREKTKVRVPLTTHPKEVLEVVSTAGVLGHTCHPSA